METPIEKNFDFSKKKMSENLVEWVEALAKIPFQNSYIETWKFLLEELISSGGFKRSLKNDNEAFFENDFSVWASGYYTDYMEMGKNIFSFDVVPRELFDTEERGSYLSAYFYGNDKAEFSLIVDGADEDTYEKFMQRLQVPFNTKMTWQEAYDNLCKIAIDEKGFIPECNISI
jgi:hypothetical protein